MAGILLSKKEADELKSTYTDSSGDFEFIRFCGDVNDYRQNGFFEQHPEIDPAEKPYRSAELKLLPISPLEGGSAGVYVRLTPEETARLAVVHTFLRDEVSCRGLLVKVYFKNYDKVNRGLITTGQFKRELNQIFPKLSIADNDLVTKAYATADQTQCRYMVLHSDITAPETGAPIPHGRVCAHYDDVMSSPPRAASTGAGGAGGATSPSRSMIDPAKTLGYNALGSDVDVSAIEATIIRQIWERRVSFRDAVSDFDPVRTGKCSRSQFVRALVTCKVSGISPAAFDKLADVYVAQEDTTGNIIHWRAFSDVVEEAFVESGFEQAPLRTLSSFAHSVVTAPHPRFVRPEVDAATKVMVDEAVAFIKETARSKRRYNIKPILQNYDIAREGLVTETQFLRVLAQFGLVPSGAEQRKVLLDYYRGQGINAHMIDYRAFLLDTYEPGMA